MKNIHVLPTDKPSRLFITDGKLFNYHKPQQGDGIKIINQNIYITNSEEIKQGDYGLVVNEILSYNKMIELWGVTQGWKIIITTDQDLIKDGVQAIDDDFLEWFVKNPSCEEVVFSTYHVKGDISGKLHYKIIIPKEEAKQETLEEAKELEKQQERMYSEEEVKKLIELHSDFIYSKIDYEDINNATTTISGTEWNDEEWFEQVKKK